MNPAGWRFTILDEELGIIDVGIVNFSTAKKLALAQYKDGRVTGSSPLSADQVKTYGIEGTFKKSRNSE
jgi:hypothetical protein